MPQSTLDNQALLQEIKNCTLCAPHLPLGARPIVQFDSKARVLIAGQAPGQITHKKGRPFDDPSGERLRAWMGVDNEVFYDAQRVAIVPMGFCYPGMGKSGDLPPRRECAVQWRKDVLASLPEIKLTLLIGQYAIDWHLQKRKKKNLTETVRAWGEYAPYYFVLPHPSPRNNLWLAKNPWFATSIIPLLQASVQKALM